MRIEERIGIADSIVDSGCRRVRPAHRDEDEASARYRSAQRGLKRRAGGVVVGTDLLDERPSHYGLTPSTRRPVPALRLPPFGPASSCTLVICEAVAHAAAPVTVCGAADASITPARPLSM